MTSLELMSYLVDRDIGNNSVLHVRMDKCCNSFRAGKPL